MTEIGCDFDGIITVRQGGTIDLREFVDLASTIANLVPQSRGLLLLDWLQIKYWAFRARMRRL